MLVLDDDARAALEDSHTPSYVAQAFYGTTLTEADVPLDVDGSLSYEGDAVMQATGTVHIRRSDRSLVPKLATDPLAPFGQELTILRRVTVGSGDAAKSWDIPMGRFRIKEVPDMRNYFRLWPSMKEIVGWEAQLKLTDLFDVIDSDDFLQAESPKFGNTAWAEIARLSPLPIVRSLPDKPVPGGLAYDSRLGAITELMKLVGGIPTLTRQGALTARQQDAWLTTTEAQATFTVDGVIDISESMSNAIYNAVVVRSATGDNSIVAVRQITDVSDPLSVNGPLRRRTYKHTSPLIETQAQADADAATVLRRVSSKQARTVDIECAPRPDLELGDVGIAVDRMTRRRFLGEVNSMTFSMDPTAKMKLRLIVAEELDVATDDELTS